MLDKEVIEHVEALRPERIPPPPRPHPSMNPGGFSNGRGVYEVEEEMLALHSQLVLGWRRVFQGAFWKLKYMNQSYWPTTVDRVLADRRAYLQSREEWKGVIG